MHKFSNNFVISSGLIIVTDEKKILLIKPKGLEIGHYSIPKGIINKNEDLKSAALRETYEEVGLKFKYDDLGKQFVINYINENIVTKRVFCYLVRLSAEIANEMLFNLQPEEVEDCGFFSKEEAKKIIFWRYLDLIDNEEIWK